MDEISYDSKEIIMVGDTVHDSEVAEAMAIDCVLVEHGHVSRKRLEKTGRKVISNLNEFLYLLNES
jgi:phosphoglycolate phosphatase